MKELLVTVITSGFGNKEVAENISLEALDRKRDEAKPPAKKLYPDLSNISLS